MTDISTGDAYEARSLANIETARRINRSAAAKYGQHGVTPIEAAIAAIYSAHDLAVEATGEGAIGAVEWLRTAIDTMERQLLEQAGGK